MKYIHGDTLKVGYVPTRRYMYDPEYAWEERDAIEKKVQELSDDGLTELVKIDWLNEEKLLKDVDDVDKVAKYFREKEVDCLFFPHTNFGCEEVVGMLARKLDVPVLLWGPRDPAPTANCAVRQTDIQCGLFASSKALQRYGVKFTYIENCDIDSPIFAKGYRDFLAVAQVVKTFRNLRIGVILPRPKPFLTVMFNEGELLEKFGIEIVPMNAEQIVRRARIILGMEDTWPGGKRAEIDEEQQKVDAALAEEIFQDYMAKEDWTEAGGEEGARKIATMEAIILGEAKKHHCDFMAIECWASMTAPMGVRLCHMFGDLTERGLPVACETDVLGAVTNALVGAAVRGENPSFFADLTIRHPENDNAELLWHCGPFAQSLRRDTEGKRRVSNYCGYYEIKHGDVTVTRFECAGNGVYKLFSAEGRGVEGPSTNGNYLWVEVDNWPKWERKFIEGPYIHHVVGVHGNVSHILKEACKYIGVQFDNPDLPN